MFEGRQVDDIQHAKIALPEPNVHPSHPFRNAKNHEKLLQYLRQRLAMGKEARDNELDRLVRIDKNVSGWMRLSPEDKKRDQKKERDGTPQAVSMNLPLTFVHIDDMMTYFAATFAPNRGMFYHTGKPGETQEASQIVTVMNNHAVYAGYYREVLQAVYSLLKYNSGGFHVYWSQDQGPKLVRDPATNTDKVETQLRWQGNRLEAIDRYNLLCDPSVPFTRLHVDGEFSAIAKLRSHFWLQNKASQGAYYNCKTALENHQGNSTCVYYRSPPREAQMDLDESGGTDWKAILSEVSYGSSRGHELVEIYIRLNPTEFGLIEGSTAARNARSRYEQWRFTLLNDEFIIDATYMNNIHGYLPHFMAVLNDDLMGSSQKSNAEILQPLQDFASFLLNTHVQAVRKNIWGLIAYDPSGLDLKQVPQGEVSARIPVKPAAQGRDIREMIWEHGSNLETKQTLQDLGAVMDVINQFFPTQALPSQIASIDRAVDSQVAAVQQGSNRRQQKAARLLDDSLFRNIRFAMYYNIIQYQKDKEQVTDFYTGKQVAIDLQALRDTDLPFIIGQGLKAIDRQAAASMLQQIIFALIQAPQAAQGIDLLGLIDYWTSMIDIDVDMTQFKLVVAAGQGGAGTEAGGEAAAGGNPINPATNPQSLTQPVFG